ncbi:hypothetical protein A0H81_02928 [Grifola frondosa]|uniref:Transmembrane protein n=1 Tax=Grifola frondosa TaxID=5627 RepID=A0A1C7MIV9_GRIFR|nr:hypothetical protein A0H81_02928 [Grifola frondosa]
MESLTTVTQIAGGIYIWDWVNTLYFDWRLASGGKEEWRWPALVYLLARFTNLIAVICQFIIMNLQNEPNCDALIRVMLSFAYISIALTSTLIAIRTIAIWNRELPVVLFATIAVLSNAGCLLYGKILNNGVNYDANQSLQGLIQNSTSVWNISIGTCVISHTARAKLGIIVTFTTSVLMLIVMLAGIWTKRGTGSLWRLLYRQGIIWVAVAILFYIPLVVLISLNVNDPTNLLLQAPVNAAMTICSTRMHRSLYEYANSNHVIVEVSGPAMKFKNGVVPMIHITRTVETHYAMDGSVCSGV